MHCRQCCSGRLIVGALVLSLHAAAAGAADWPMWRYDCARSAAAPEELPARLYMQWSRPLGESRPAWSDPRLDFEASHEPIVMGEALIVGSSRHDCVTAYSTRTGQELWRFHTGGPVRFAPAGWRDRVFVGCDDGSVYCLRVADGRPLWRFMAAPRSRRIVGNGRLISAWPIRGGPIVADDRLYFIAGTWPFMGIFAYCLDAATGAVIWDREDAGTLYQVQGHEAPGYGGLTPQGYLVVDGEHLLVPTGRSFPACLDRQSGDFLYHHIGWNSGDVHVCAGPGYYVNGGIVFDTASGDPGYLFRDEQPGSRSHCVITPDQLYTTVEGGLVVRDVQGLTVPALADKSRWYARLGWLKQRGMLKDAPSAPTIEADSVWMKAGGRLYVSKGRTMTVVDLASGMPVWIQGLSKPPATVLAGDGRLFIVTTDGTLHCFGPKLVKPVSYDPPGTEDQAGEGVVRHDGYRVLIGYDDPRFLANLARTSSASIVCLASDRRRAGIARATLGADDLYGERVAVLEEEGVESLPPYLADLVAVAPAAAERYLQDAAALAEVLRVMRPYGGVATLESDQVEKAEELLRDARFEGVKMRVTGPFIQLTRSAGPVGAADWTHQNADAAGSSFARDDAVRPPFGVLWFGDLKGDGLFFDRHTHPPRQQVAAGRMVIEAAGKLSAVDIYTGRMLWEKEIPGLGRPFEGLEYQAGARLLGGNYVTLPDSIYVNTGRECLRLDPKSGDTLATFSLPGEAGEQGIPPWAFASVSDDVLIGTAALDVIPHSYAESDLTHYPHDRLGALVAFVDRYDADHRLARRENETDVSYVARNLTAMVNAIDFSERLSEDELGRSSKAALSGGNWLQGRTGVLGVVRFAEYRLSVPVPGIYRLWVRKFWHHGPFRWRFGEQEWQTCDENIPLADGRGTYLWKHTCANWKSLQDVTLAKGPHTFRVEILEEPGEGAAAAFDCFALIEGPRSPDGLSPPRIGRTIWWEGEDATRHNFPPDDAFNPVHPSHRARAAAIKEEIREARRLKDDVARVTRIRNLNVDLIETYHPAMPLLLPSRKIGKHPWSGAASRRLIAMDRFSGKTLWERDARLTYRHNAIVAGGGRVFCVDRVPAEIDHPARRYGGTSEEGTLLCLDAKTGRVIWETSDGVEAEWLAYSVAHDVLVASADPSLLRASTDKEKAVIHVRRGSDGSKLWEQTGYGLCVLRDDTLIVGDSAAFGLLDGRPLPWSMPNRTKGCGSFLTGQHVVTFRSATAAYYDLDHADGTSGLGGLRIACMDNALPAGGVLNIPNMASGCDCNYPIQTSIALVTDPDAERWAWGIPASLDSFARLGLNLGAPGDRLSDEGTLWLDYPSVGGPSPELTVETDPAEVSTFRRHSLRVTGDGLKWVAGSGVRGLKRLKMTLPGNFDGSGTVRLHFAEPDAVAPEDRVFDVSLQGKKVLSGFDIRRESDGRLRTLVREFLHVELGGILELELTPVKGESVLCGVEIIQTGLDP